ncbi:MAG TPA: carboxypeptidase regulatory-like domain-containing protein, partial [Blastocatellia bacterium]|nr:carboxypeptidase regulatory-like domain-containing protein [Blastocatellia bacterium]
MKAIRQMALCLGLLLSANAAAFAQNSAGSLSGAVTDANGAAVTQVKVIARQDSTGRQFETVTTSEGLYAFPNLDVGAYTLVVEQPGFKKLTQSNVIIAISNRTVADLKLETGDVSQSVTVTSDATSLQTATTEIGVNFSPKLFKDAPIYAGGIRNPENFIGFQPGVVNGAGAEGGISGGARRSKEILIDGANATNPESGGVAFNGLPSVEALGEFKLINNTFAAEYGRTGGGVESFVTASGGNQFHGNAFNYHTSSALSANAWATNAATVGATPARKTPYHGNEYGFALGGPVYLPKKVFGPIGGYNEDKTRTFFFFSLDNFRRVDSSSAFYNLPTAKQRAGDFSELGQVIYDPLTGQPFPGNVIPQDRFSKVSRNILALLPQPTSPGLQQNYLGVLTSTSKQDSWSLKINHNFSSKHLFNFFYTQQDLGSLIDGPLPAPLLGANRNAVSANKPIFARFNYDWIFTPTLNLHVTYGTTRLRQYFDNQSVGQGLPQRLGLTGVADGETSAFPVVQFSNGGYQAYADTNGFKTKGTQFNNTEHIRADVSWVRGNFNWKFGLDHRWMKTTGEELSTGGFDDAGVQGVFAFSNAQTASTASPSATGDAFASFLLGLVNTASRTYNANASDAKFGYNAWYAQTDWRLRPNLTLNFGLRYEIPIPRSTDPTAFTSFDPNLTDPRSGLKGALAYLGDCAGCINSERFAKIDYSSVGPRLGLAWSVNQKTVLRLGYGIYYAAGNGLTGGFCIRCQNGYSNTASLSGPGTTGAALQWDNGFVPSANFLAPPIISPSAGN